LAGLKGVLVSEVSVVKLRKLVSRALDDDGFMQKLLASPDVVAEEAGLSAEEALVVRQMTRERFESAARDASAQASATGELSDADLGAVVGGAMSLSTSRVVTADMVIGRSITSATGGSLGGVVNAGCDCCKWKGGIGMDSVVLPAIKY